MVEPVSDLRPVDEMSILIPSGSRNVVFLAPSQNRGELSPEVGEVAIRREVSAPEPAQPIDMPPVFVPVEEAGDPRSWRVHECRHFEGCSTAVRVVKNRIYCSLTPMGVVVLDLHSEHPANDIEGGLLVRCGEVHR